MCICMLNDIESKIRCEKCNSTQTYLRLSLGQRVCRKCGHISKYKVEEKETKNGR